VPEAILSGANSRFFYTTMKKHLLNLALILVGASLAFGSTFYIRGHHSVVSPHSASEGAITFIFWVSVLILLIPLPVFLSSRLSHVPFPTALRCLAWLSFGSVGPYLCFVTRPILIVPYVAAAGCGYLFASDVFRSFRARSWVIFTTSLFGWGASAIVFFCLASAFLYVE
jgi:hypothetical protein